MVCRINFTIRDLLWLMVVVGLAFGWWNDRRDWERRESRLASNWAQRLADATGENIHVSTPRGEWLVVPVGDSK